MPQRSKPADLNVDPMGARLRQGDSIVAEIMGKRPPLCAAVSVCRLVVTLRRSVATYAFNSELPFHPQMTLIASGSHRYALPSSQLAFARSAGAAARNPKTASSTTGLRLRTEAKKFVW